MSLSTSTPSAALNRPSLQQSAQPLTPQQRQISNLSAQIAALSHELQDTEQELCERDATIAQLKAQVASQSPPNAAAKTDASTLTDPSREPIESSTHTLIDRKELAALQSRLASLESRDATSSDYLQQYREQLDKLTNENDALATSMQQIELRLESSQSAAAQAKTEASKQLHDAQSAHQFALKSLQAELQSTQVTHASYVASSQSAVDDCSSLRNEVRQLQSDLARANVKIDIHDESMRQVKSHSDTLLKQSETSKLKQIERLNEDHASIVQQLEQRLATQSTTSQNALESLQQRYDTHIAAHTDCSNLSEQAVDLRRQLSMRLEMQQEAERSLFTAQRDLVHAKENCELLQRRLASEVKQGENLTHDLTRMQTSLHSLQTQLDAATNQPSNQPTASSESTGSNSAPSTTHNATAAIEISRLKAEISSLQSQLSAQCTLCKDVESKLAVSENIQLSLRTDIHELQSKLELNQNLSPPSATAAHQRTRSRSPSAQSLSPTLQRTRSRSPMHQRSSSSRSASPAIRRVDSLTLSPSASTLRPTTPPPGVRRQTSLSSLSTGRNTPRSPSPAPSFNRRPSHERLSHSLTSPPSVVSPARTAALQSRWASPVHHAKSTSMSSTRLSTGRVSLMQRQTALMNQHGSRSSIVSGSQSNTRSRTNKADVVTVPEVEEIKSTTINRSASRSQSSTNYRSRSRSTSRSELNGSTPNLHVTTHSKNDSLSNPIEALPVAASSESDAPALTVLASLTQSASSPSSSHSPGSNDGRHHSTQSLSLPHGALSPLQLSSTPIVLKPSPRTRLNVSTDGQIVDSQSVSPQGRTRRFSSSSNNASTNNLTQSVQTQQPAVTSTQ